MMKEDFLKAMDVACILATMPQNKVHKIYAGICYASHMLQNLPEVKVSKQEAMELFSDIWDETLTTGGRIDIQRLRNQLEGYDCE